jgi:orotate phosphoribosyltransferase
VRPFAPAVVCGPLTGGAFVGLLVAEALGTAFVPTARRTAVTGPVHYDLPAPLRPLLAGVRVAIVDDAVNAGSATLASRAAIEAAGGDVVVAPPSLPAPGRRRTAGGPRSAAGRAARPAVRALAGGGVPRSARRGAAGATGVTGRAQAQETYAVHLVVTPAAVPDHDFVALGGDVDRAGGNGDSARRRRGGCWAQRR